MLNNGLKFSLLFFSILGASAWAKKEIITGVYECSGNVKKREFQITLDAKGVFEQISRVYMSDGSLKIDTESGKNFYANKNILFGTTHNRERIVKKDDVTVAVQEHKSKVKLKGLDSFPAPKKGLSIEGSVERNVFDKMTKDGTPQITTFTIKVVGQEALRHPVLGTLTVWTTKQNFSVSSKNKELYTADIKTKYHPDYGHLEWEEVDSLSGKEVYFEKCSLANRKKE